MTTKEKVARRKLSLLELAKELDNVSRACKVMGYSRQQFYEIRRNFQTYGAASTGPPVHPRAARCPRPVSVRPPRHRPTRRPDRDEAGVETRAGASEEVGTWKGYCGRGGGGSYSSTEEFPVISTNRTSHSAPSASVSRSTSFSLKCTGCCRPSLMETLVA